MISMDEIESGLLVTHKATGLRYSVIDAEADEVLLSPEQDGLQDLTVALALVPEAVALSWSVVRTRCSPGAFGSRPGGCLRALKFSAAAPVPGRTPM